MARPGQERSPHGVSESENLEFGIWNARFTPTYKELCEYFETHHHHGTQRNNCTSTGFKSKNGEFPENWLDWFQDDLIENLR